MGHKRSCHFRVKSSEQFYCSDPDTDWNSAFGRIIEKSECAKCKHYHKPYNYSDEITYGSHIHPGCGV